MKNHSTLLTKNFTFAFVLLLALASISGSNASENLPPKLSAVELDALLGEINSMIKTDESLADSFVVKEATPERIEQFFAAPEFAAQPKNIRENALIFAGKSKLLSFEQPSDIINKVSTWFPQEVTAARAKQELGYFSYLRLYGPYPSWQDEPAAFLTLWNCMPQVAWSIAPTQNPFMGRLNSKLPFMSSTDRQSGEFDFGRCVRERSSYRSSTAIQNNQIIELDPRLLEQERLEMGKRVAPILQTKFARALAKNRCTKSGADDCVLSLLMWSSLSPDDVNLVRALQNLESDIAPDSPLPALQTPSAANPAGYEPRFDEYLRRAAFLRAKLLSVISAKQVWQDSALAATLQQISHLQQLYGEALSTLKESWRVNDIYEIGYRNSALDPRYALSLGIAKTPEVQAVLNATLENIDSEAGCRSVRTTLGDDPVARNRFALRHLIDNPFVCNVQPDWQWLIKDQSEPAQQLRSQYLALLGTHESGALHETLLDAFTGAYWGCFSQLDSATPDQTVRPDWWLKICRAWVSEPQAVSLKLKHSPYTLSQAEQFQRMALAGIPNTVGSGVLSPQQDAWLMGLVQGMDAVVMKKMQAFAADLRARNVVIEHATLWSHPQHRTALISLAVYGGNEAPVLAISPDNFSEIHTADRFSYSRVGGQLAYVSDLDNDGNLEMWLGDTSNFCQQDDTDLQRDLYCKSTTAEMGELYGDTLSYFADTPQPRNLHAMPSPLLKNVQPIIEPAREENQQCNRLLIAPVLSQKLKIDFGDSSERYNRGAVIDLVCKPHPQHPAQTIVALFYDLPSSNNANDLEQKGFALAVVDMAAKKVLRLYTDRIEVDGSIRIFGDGGLSLDTPRYNLAPNVRALGVRMDIGYSPRCAEGGESNYLSLFVEDGAQLKPILKNFAMRSWSITDGSNGCGYSENPSYTQEEVNYTLSISDSVTEGWHDLELAAHKSITVYGSTVPDSEIAASTPPKTSSLVIGKFRAKNKMYSLDTPALK
jgi:hypothetical protein